jgi:hypothetical protein
VAQQLALKCLPHCSAFPSLLSPFAGATCASAYTDFRDTAAKDALRQRVIFRTSAGKLILGEPVTDEHIRIDYMALVRSSDGTLTMTPIPDAALPSCPMRNRFICTEDPSSTSCIRFVRVRICEPGSGNGCDPVGYAPLVSIVPFFGADATDFDDHRQSRDAGLQTGTV